jgi:hypothetical protein
VLGRAAPWRGEQGIVASVTTDSPMPTQLAGGWPPIRSRAARRDVGRQHGERRCDQLLRAALGARRR